jgi:hypothetical protein
LVHNHNIRRNSINRQWNITTLARGTATMSNKHIDALLFIIEQRIKEQTEGDYEDYDRFEYEDY